MENALKLNLEKSADKSKMPFEKVVLSKDGKRVVVLVKRQVLTTKMAVEFLLSGTLGSKVCRYCLHVTAPLTELDQLLNIGGKFALYEVTVRDIVAGFYPFKVADTPNFPNKICEKCLDKALKAYLFAQQCEQSERALRNCFDDMYNKFEKLDTKDGPKKRGKQKQYLNFDTLYTDNRYVIDYAEPLYHLVNTNSETLTPETPMSNLECKRCWQVLPDLPSLLNHQKTHPDTMWFNCRACGKSFAKKFHLARHLREHARQKLDESTKKEPGLVCKECGLRSTHYNEHLRHLEKHKFKDVMKHLVERKMDKLCNVCFEKNGRMVEMDKIVCLHGGLPELTGDRTMFNILASTVPEPNYKFRELLVPHQASIVTITRKAPNVTNKMFELSWPYIISSLKIVKAATKLYKFSAPKLILDDNQREFMEYEDLESDNLGNSDTNNNDTTPKNDQQEVSDNEYMDNNSKEEFKLAESRDNDHSQISTKSNCNIDQSRKVNTVKTITEQPCKICWLFKKPVCQKCIDLEENSKVQKMGIANNILGINKVKEGKKVSQDCQCCWIFEKTRRCDYCKNSTQGISETNESNAIIDDIDNSTSANTIVVEKGVVFEDATKLDRNKTTKRKAITTYRQKPKRTKWQCKICLISNEFNRETCVCCESRDSYEDSMKFNFNSAPNYFNIKNNKSNYEDEVNTVEVSKSTDINISNIEVRGQQDNEKERNDVKSYSKDFMQWDLLTSQEVLYSNEAMNINYIEDNMSLDDDISSTSTISTNNLVTGFDTIPMDCNENINLYSVDPICVPNNLQFTVGTISPEEKLKKANNKSLRRNYTKK